MDNYLSEHFLSTSIIKESGELRNRCVCGMWHLNDENKIDTLVQCEMSLKDGRDSSVK